MHYGGRDDGFTLTELVISLVVLSVVVFSLTGLFTSLVHSAVIAKEKAVASTLATNQMEYLKSLPYDSLAVAGGSIYATNLLPASSTQTVNGVKYTVKTSISYVDDAYDGCGSYPNQTLKQTYCRNYPPPSGAPATDSNPADYKIANVTVYNPDSTQLASVDTQISARVAETASTTGALFVNVNDSSGAPVSGATVNVVDNTVSPAVNVSDSTDENGIAIFYGLPPDTNNYDYTITASDNGYSTLTTIVPSGSLQPTYPSQKIFSQQSSYVTLTIKLQGPDSLLLETTDTNGNPLPNVKVYVKGGYKKYTLTTDTTYYYDNLSPSDSRPTTDSNGLAGISNLVPGQYIFCGDTGGTSCVVGGTTYYLVAALPYSGNNSLNPVSVPTFDPSNPPVPTYTYNGHSYYQEVRLMLSTNASFPRVNNFTPYDVSLSGGALASFGFQINGTNLPCSSTPASCGTSVKFVQGSNSYTASCTGTSGSQINCTANLTGIIAGNAQLVVTANGFTLTLPASPQMGGLSVTP
jgi:prepilin-type N-terminal cleavage/methylation domain-containing protein